MGFSKKEKHLGDRQKRSKGEMANRSISRHEMADTETEGCAAANTHTHERKHQIQWIILYKLLKHRV